VGNWLADDRMEDVRKFVEALEGQWATKHEVRELTVRVVGLLTPADGKAGGLFPPLLKDRNFRRKNGGRVGVCAARLALELWPLDARKAATLLPPAVPGESFAKARAEAMAADLVAAGIEDQVARVCVAARALEGTAPREVADDGVAGDAAPTSEVVPSSAGDFTVASLSSLFEELERKLEAYSLDSESWAAFTAFEHRVGELRGRKELETKATRARTRAAQAVRECLEAIERAHQAQLEFCELLLPAAPVELSEDTAAKAESYARDIDAAARDLADVLDRHSEAPTMQTKRALERERDDAEKRLRSSVDSLATVLRTGPGLKRTEARPTPSAPPPDASANQAAEVVAAFTRAASVSPQDVAVDAEPSDSQEVRTIEKRQAEAEYRSGSLSNAAGNPPMERDTSAAARERETGTATAGETIEPTRVDPLPADSRSEVVLPTTSRRPSKPAHAFVETASASDALGLRATAAIWALLSNGHPSAAALLDECASLQEIQTATAPRAALEVDTLVIGAGFDSDWADRLHEAVTRLRDTLRSFALDQASSAFTLLVVAEAALRVPGLQSSAMAAMKGLQVPEASLAKFRDAMLALEARTGALGPDMLRRFLTHEAAETNVARAREEFELEWKRSREGKLRFARATNAWMRLMAPDGAMGRDLAAICDEVRSSEAASRIDAFEQKWTQDEVRRRVTELDARLAGPTAKKQPLEGSVLTKDIPAQLKRIMAAAENLRAKLKQPNHPLDSSMQTALQQAGGALKHASRNLHNVDWASDVQRPALKGRIERLERLLSNGVDASDAQHGSPLQALRAEWLLFDDVRLASDMSLTTKPSFDKLLGVAERLPNRGAVLARVEASATNADHNGNARSFAHLNVVIANLHRREVDADAASTANERAHNLRKELVRKLERDVNSALTENLKPENVIAQYLRSLEFIDTLAVEPLELDELRERSDAILQEISAERQAKTTELRAQIGRLAPTDEQKTSLEQAIASNELAVAAEIVTAIQNGTALPRRERGRDVFREFFPDLSNKLNTWADGTNGEFEAVTRLLSSMEGKHAGPLDFSRVDDGQRRRSAKVLVERWSGAKRKKPSPGATGHDDLKKHVFEIFQGLDWEVDEVSLSEKSPRSTVFRVKTRPLYDLNRFVHPAYGSQAKGQYQVLCTWDRPSEELLLELVTQVPHDAAAPTVVFYFGRFPESKRRHLAALCREKRRSFVVLDDLLLMYLTTEPDSRAATFLACATPFVPSSPYTTTAGPVAPEMFFGRRAERERIWRRDAGTIVYGGRQLGKTALLRAVEREYHRPENGILVCWIDLKEEGIGHARNADEIWSVVAEKLQRYGVVKSGTTNVATLQKAVRTWLDADSSRRIVLLLDEADEFLRHDASLDTRERDEHGRVRQAEQEGFRLVSAFKKITDENDKRFKVVFAGLHNVQRAARNVNSPLFHFGEPICVGPLYGENLGESQAALDLVVKPLEALGFYFKDETLPWRILAYTNWYPSLVQVFCTKLHEHMLREGSRTSSLANAPPAIIRSDDIDNAYHEKGLRDEILKRFQITLDLDRRYRVLALSIALETIADAARGVDDGFSVDVIREQALYWWDRGFGSSRSIEHFRALLDEMVGLGVLRSPSPERYALRNPNVRNLLGTREAIERDLMDAALQDPAPDDEPSTFRRTVSVEAEDGNQTRLRSPFTALQENELVARQSGASIVFGGVASGIERVKTFLEHAIGGATIRTLERSNSCAEFKSELDGVINEAEEGAVNLFVIPEYVPWDREWVDVAFNYARRKRKHATRLIFVGDAEHARRWSVDGRGRDANTKANLLSLTKWAPAALRRLLWHYMKGDADVTVLAEKTGGWGGLVAQVDDRLLANPNASVREVIDDVRPRWLRAVASDVPAQLRDVAKEFATYGAMSKQDCLEICGSRERALSFLAFGEIMGFLERNGDEIVLDPIISMALTLPTAQG
jgi:hypothetical protein